MNEGTYRILRASAETPAKLDDLVARAGEARSVVKRLLEEKSKWFAVEEGRVACTQTGMAALAYEMVARQRAKPLSERSRTLIEGLRELAQKRSPAKRELDQIWASLPSVVRRAERLVAAGEVQRGLVFLGDDDLCSLAIHLVEVGTRTTVIDVDQDLLKMIDDCAQDRHFEINTVAHDLREPCPKSLRGKFGCVFTDPPYAPEGFALFVGRAIELLRPDGRLYVNFGWSRRALERGLEKQRILAQCGLLVLEVVPDCTEYEGAHSIGCRSDLWICSKTPQTKPHIPAVEGPLYTSRSPRSPT